MNTDRIAEYRKAIAAVVLAPLLALGTALADGQITGPEWIGIAVALVVGGGGVALVPNEPTAQQRDQVEAEYVAKHAAD